MYLRSFLLLGPVVCRTLTTFGRPRERASIEDRGRRLRIPLGEKSNDHAQVVPYLLEDTGLHPAAGLLIDRGPGREIVWQESPLTPRRDNVTHRVEQIAQRIFALGRILAHQAQVREKKLPFGIRDVAGIRLPCRVHAVT